MTSTWPAARRPAATVPRPAATCSSTPPADAPPTPVDNAFITQFFDWDRPAPRKARWLNGLIHRLGYDARVVLPHETGEMTTVEERMNIYHLLTHLLHFGV